MAYVTCPRCGLTDFTTAYWSSTDYCGRCGAELPHPPTLSEPLSRYSRLRRNREALWRPRVKWRGRYRLPNRTPPL